MIEVLKYMKNYLNLDSPMAKAIFDINKNFMEIEDVIRKVRTKSKIESEKEIREVFKSESVHFIDSMVEELSDYEEEFVKPTLERIYFLLAFTGLEHSLVRICNAWTIENNISKFKQIRGKSMVESIRIFLKDEVGILVNEHEELWDELNNWNSIRNSLVHSFGLLVKQNQMKAARILGLETEIEKNFFGENEIKVTIKKKDYLRLLELSYKIIFCAVKK